MERRTILKRLGATGLSATAIIAGTASAGGTPGEPRRVEVDGETYIAYGDVSVEDVDPAGSCTCEYCDPWLCDFCGPC